MTRFDSGGVDSGGVDSGIVVGVLRLIILINILRGRRLLYWAVWRVHLMPVAQ